MDPKTKMLIEELIHHIEGSQADDLMGLMNKAKAPEMGEPKGIAIEKIEMKPKKDFDGQANDAIDAMGDPGSLEESSESPEERSKEAAPGGEDPEMTDAELADLLKQYIK